MCILVSESGRLQSASARLFLKISLVLLTSYWGGLAFASVFPFAFLLERTKLEVSLD